jgi:surface antigen
LFIPKKQQNISQQIREHVMTSKVAGYVVVTAALAVVLFGVGFGSHAFNAHAANSCAAGDSSYSVKAGDTLGMIAQQHKTSVAQLASHNKISNPNFINAGDTLCIPGATSKTSQTANTANHAPINTNIAAAVRGIGDFFPYGQCTWWASQRYHQLHGIYVPWMINANAYQWVARAYEFHWRVSSQPSVGAIIVLAPWTQGTWGVGHVGVVESVSGNRVLVSNMNWNGAGSNVTDWTFSAGAGVSFVTSY